MFQSFSYQIVSAYYLFQLLGSDIISRKLQVLEHENVVSKKHYLFHPRWPQAYINVAQRRHSAE